MKRYAALVVLALMLVVSVMPVNAQASTQESALSWMRQIQEPSGGVSNGFSEGADFGATVEVILAAVAVGQDVSQWVTPEGNSPLDYIQAHVAGGRVSDVGDLSRAILVAVATGQNPRSFGGRDLVRALAVQQDAQTGMFGGDLFKHAYAVLALHNAGASIPASAVTAMTSQFTEDGGWALFGGTVPGTADTNTTALVMQALVAVGEVDAAAGALAYLHRMQNSDGGFPYQNPSPWGTDTDANSTAIVIQALNALDEPMSNWAGSGTDPVGALIGLWDEETGAFYWQQTVPAVNLLATAQSAQAIVGMTLVNVPQVGAAGIQPVVEAVVPLMPASGVNLVSATLLLLGGIGVVLALSGVVRRSGSPRVG
jgi:hypothetical protein